MADRRTSGTNDVSSFFDASTVEEFFKAIRENADMLKSDFARLGREVAKEEAKYQRKYRQDMLKELLSYEQRNGRLSDSQRLKYMQEQTKKYESERSKKRLKDDLALVKQVYGIQTKYDKQRRKEELEESRKNNQQLYKELKEIQKKLRKEGKDLTDEQKELMNQAKSDKNSAYWGSVLDEFKDGLTDNVKSIVSNIRSLFSDITGKMSTYTSYQSGINARLQGSSINTGSYGSNYFSALESKLTEAVGTTPYFSTEKMLSNLQSLVQSGIASNVEQRAFIQTAKDEIATTFDASESALLRIIRLQQQDSTAARLGMEAYLTRFLNELTDNTEYLNQTFDTVQSALLEASSLMSEQASTEFEYIVQKWLGSLSGVGFSESSATGIAEALGYLGSGNVSALNSSSFQNLLVMAASRSGLSYSDLLQNGVSAPAADSLMRSLVGYMAEIGSSGSNVVKSQFAQTFGLSVSDLVAANNLVGSLGDVYGNMLSFSGMYDELASQLNSVPGRLTMSGMIDTLASNLQFGLASNIASNPAMAALWRISNMISDAGGIAIPFVSAAGFGYDPNAKLEELLRASLVGVSSLGMIGDIVSGISNTAMPSRILSSLGISANSTSISRGTGISGRSSGMSTSLSAYVGQSSGDDVYNSAMTSYNEDKNAAVSDAQQQQTDYAQKIYEYMSDRVIGRMDSMQKALDALNSTTDSIRSAIDSGVSVNVNGLNSMLSNFGL